MLRLFSLLSHLSFIQVYITLSPSSTSLFCTMKGFHIVALLSSAMLLVSAAPALQLVTCTAESGAAAARLAMHRINENHRHGYKFRLQEIQGNKVEKVDDGCNLELQLNLQETVCHVVNPKHFEDCQIRGEAERAVTANCTVKMSVKNNDANVTKYECDTRQVKTDVDVPVLVPLNSTEGLKSVNEAESKFNQNATNKHHYILKEVGRIRLGSGKDYYAEFALVETQCPMGSRISIEACKPLCPDRASSVNSIPHRTRLPLALVSKSPYAGIMWVAILPMQAVADLPLDAYCLPLVAMAILPMLAMAPLPLEAMAIHPVPVALLTMVAMANLPMQAVADLPLDAYCLPLVAEAILPMLAKAPLPTEVMAIDSVPVALLTMGAMAILPV
ncbi:hypothetical protein PFLUV_G00114250 [Perca fluviatilis]|uniref:Cystatin domain-containing protein n=1 Tax=Perca fluviatilis TaxID=8168 RepID=A0A6A5EAK9_PERFL|nr:hypothetical protein PFLUV_G00114250 [Perca fluviatilis]